MKFKVLSLFVGLSMCLLFVGCSKDSIDESSLIQSVENPLEEPGSMNLADASKPLEEKEIAKVWEAGIAKFNGDIIDASHLKPSDLSWSLFMAYLGSEDLSTFISFVDYLFQGAIAESQIALDPSLKSLNPTNLSFLIFDLNETNTLILKVLTEEEAKAFLMRDPNKSLLIAIEKGGVTLPTSDEVKTSDTEVTAQTLTDDIENIKKNYIEPVIDDIFNLISLAFPTDISTTEGGMTYNIASDASVLAVGVSGNGSLSVGDRSVVALMGVNFSSIDQFMIGSDATVYVQDFYGSLSGEVMGTTDTKAGLFVINSEGSINVDVDGASLLIQGVKGESTVNVAATSGSNVQLVDDYNFDANIVADGGSSVNLSNNTNASAYVNAHNGTTINFTNSFGDAFFALTGGNVTATVGDGSRLAVLDQAYWSLLGSTMPSFGR